MNKQKPKILICGYGQHGKDTFGEILRDLFGYKISSSSWFACQKFIFGQMKLRGANYSTPEQCWADRHNCRSLWYNLISEYNRGDPSRLARELLAEHDVYVGMRNVEEFKACQDEGLFDLVVWVDRSKHVAPEDKSSNTITPDLCDIMVSNNDSLDELKDLADFISEWAENMLFTRKLKAKATGLSPLTYAGLEELAGEIWEW